MAKPHTRKTLLRHDAPDASSPTKIPQTWMNTARSAPHRSMVRVGEFEVAMGGGVWVATRGYGTDLRAQYRRAAWYVSRILAGARPAELPVEQPARFEMALNLATARALGITVPNSLLVQADELIG